MFHFSLGWLSDIIKTPGVNYVLGECGSEGAPLTASCKVSSSSVIAFPESVHDFSLVTSFRLAKTL